MRYDDSILHPPGPIVPVQVRPAGRLEPIQTKPGELDTGSDITVIPDALVDNLRLRAEDSVLMIGYDDIATERTTYSVDLEIAEYKLESVRVVAAPRNTILLGRDILNRFIITLDGKALTFEMKDP